MSAEVLAVAAARAARSTAWSEQAQQFVDVHPAQGRDGVVIAQLHRPGGVEEAHGPSKFGAMFTSPLWVLSVSSIPALAVFNASSIWWAYSPTLAAPAAAAPRSTLLASQLALLLPWSR